MYEDTLSYKEILTFMESAPANIFFKDTECKYRFVTEVCNQVNGGAEHSILGKTDLEIQKIPEYGRFYYEDDQKILATGEGSKYINEFPTESGSVYFEIKKNPVFSDGKIIGIIGIINDVTKQVLQEKELEELSFRDKLTGLYNRNYMESRSHRYVRGDDFPTSLIMADCNYLKRVNDTLGHEYGDILLRRVARSIEETIPDGCIAIRTGGDEFLILCPKCSAETAQELIVKIRQRFVEKSDKTLTLDASFGSYTAVDDTLSFDEALRRADQAMYENKRKFHQQQEAAGSQTNE